MQTCDMTLPPEQVSNALCCGQSTILQFSFSSHPLPKALSGDKGFRKHKMLTVQNTNLQHDLAPRKSVKRTPLCCGQSTILQFFQFSFFKLSLAKSTLRRKKLPKTQNAYSAKHIRAVAKARFFNFFNQNRILKLSI